MNTGISKLITVLCVIAEDIQRLTHSAKQKPSPVMVKKNAGLFMKKRNDFIF